MAGRLCWTACMRRARRRAARRRAARRRPRPQQRQVAWSFRPQTSGPQPPRRTSSRQARRRRRCRCQRPQPLAQHSCRMRRQQRAEPAARLLRLQRRRRMPRLPRRWRSAPSPPPSPRTTALQVVPPRRRQRSLRRCLWRCQQRQGGAAAAPRAHLLRWATRWPPCFLWKNWTSCRRCCCQVGASPPFPGAGLLALCTLRWPL